ncbi:MAG: OB-fold nucleic acid binding domain-containing protein [Chloroflexi bacterium]|nr:OB-fold nucleic acid binding domain-containing protein [Chloroflexota bacterium]
MPYEVFSLFSQCSEIHGAHSSLEDAAGCFAQVTQRYGADIPVHPVTQKYIHWIVAIDKNGNQRDFSNSELMKVGELCLDCKSFAAKVPGITTFSQLAGMYYEASRLIPVTHINLKGMFDYQAKDRHFWTSDAGKGQALAFAQQAAFTLELAFKAYLEVLGKLASPDAADAKKWQTHKLVDLFKLLADDEKRQLEEWWSHSDTKRTHFHGSFRDFLSESNRLYEKWRYITDLTSPDLSIDIPKLLSAAEFLLSASSRAFEKNSPIKLNITTTVYPNSDVDDGSPAPRYEPTLVEGRVRAVNIPDGYDPFSIVEVVIDSDRHEDEVIAQFYKCHVENYFGLEGKQVALFGNIRKDRPRLLARPRHLDELKRESVYAVEHCTLKGSIHDIRTVHSAHGKSGKLDLSLWDETYFTQVECIFVTDKERDQLRGINPGDTILISGWVTLLNGRPVVLVHPNHIEKVVE